MTRMMGLIASDLDGTLLDQQGRLPEGIFDAILALKETGIWFAAASGRQYDNLKRLFAPVWRDMAFVCENGGLVAVGDRVIKTVYFEKAMAQAIIADILGAGMELLISAPQCCYMLPGSKAFTDDVFYRLRNTCAIVGDPCFQSDGYIKLSGFHPTNVASLAPPLQKKWAGLAHADIAGRCWLDFTLGSKGEGLSALTEELRISLADTAAFGDQFNDVSMLRLVGAPYLMESAPQALRGLGFTPCAAVLPALLSMLRR